MCFILLTVSEIEKYKNQQTLESFQIQIRQLWENRYSIPIQPELKSVSEKVDVNENDIVDTHLLNEVFVGRGYILITEDKKLRKKLIRWEYLIRYLHRFFFGKNLCRTPRIFRFFGKLQGSKMFKNLKFWQNKSWWWFFHQVLKKIISFDKMVY